MKLPKVVHCQKSDYDIYIGRPSKWGNPFEIGKDGTRSQVIDKYREWLLGKMREEPDAYDLDELDGKILGCWCKPKACHGDVLVDMIRYQYYED